MRLRHGRGQRRRIYAVWTIGRDVCSVSEDARGGVKQYEGVLSVFSGSGFLSVCEDKIRLISHSKMNVTPRGLRTGNARLLGQRGHFAPDNDGERSSVENEVFTAQPRLALHCVLDLCRVLNTRPPL